MAPKKTSAKSTPQRAPKPVPPVNKANVSTVSAAPAPSAPPAPPPAEVKTDSVVATLEQAESSDLPVPESERLTVVEATDAPGSITTEEIPVEPEGVGASDASIEEPACTSEALSTVSVRALVSCDFPPMIGNFSFQQSVGRDSNTGKPIKGQFRKDYVYRVPKYVADALIEKNWILILG